MAFPHRRHVAWFEAGSIHRELATISSLSAVWIGEIFGHLFELNRSAMSMM